MQHQFSWPVAAVGVLKRERLYTGNTSAVEMWPFLNLFPLLGLHRKQRCVSTYSKNTQ